jgi:hypothetical protein
MTNKGGGNPRNSCGELDHLSIIMAEQTDFIENNSMITLTKMRVLCMDMATLSLIHEGQTSKK